MTTEYKIALWVLGVPSGLTLLFALYLFIYSTSIS